MEVVTYANKSFGMFERLVDNPYGVNVRVLGWGTTWNGYQDKSKGLLEYLKRKHDDDIVVFVDGFDSEINRPLCNLPDLFKQTKSKVLMSKEVHFGSGMFKPMLKSIFGDCHSNLIANTGMYMGYAKYLRIVLQDALRNTCSDDQVGFNKMCKKYPFIRVDVDEVIFKNIPPNQTKKQNEQAIFVSYPGSLNVDRVLRAIKEYTQFFYIKIMSVIGFLMFLFPKMRMKLTYLMIALTIYLFIFADTSCIKT